MTEVLDPAALDPATAYLHDPRRVPPANAAKAEENDVALKEAQRRIAAYHAGVAARAATSVDRVEAFAAAVDARAVPLGAVALPPPGAELQ